jgi:hypothetical protein
MENRKIDWLKCFFLFLAITFAFLWLRGCGAPKTPQIVTVTVPEVHGTFKSQKPINHPMAIGPILPYSRGQENGKINIVDTSDILVDTYTMLLAQNDSLKSAFAKETDSLKRQLIFEKAVQLNKFSTKFEDENIELNISGIVQGEVKEVTPNYRIKQREIKAEVKCRETALRVLIGAKAGIPTSNTLSLPVQANLMFQNRKGNIISVGYDNSSTIWLGYHLSIVNIKR